MLVVGRGAGFRRRTAANVDTNPEMQEACAENSLTTDQKGQMLSSAVDQTLTWQQCSL